MFRTVDCLVLESLSNDDGSNILIRGKPVFEDELRSLNCGEEIDRIPNLVDDHSFSQTS